MDGSLNEILDLTRAKVQTLDVMELLRNPYFLVGAAAFCALTLLKRMINTLVMFGAAVGLAVLFHYTVPAGGVSEIQTDNIVYFAGGGLAICGLLIYFLFIRSE